MNEEVKKWLEKISSAEKKWQEYHELIEQIRDYYTDKKRKNKQNIFWSSIETLKPFIYFKAPTPYVERKSKVANPVEDAACHILEKALMASLEGQDFDGVIKYARNDYLLSGLGLVYEKFVPEMENVSQPVYLEDGSQGVAEVEVMSSATVETNYIDPTKLIFDCSHVAVWEDCEWVAQKIEMTKQEVIDQFGEDKAALILKDATDEETELTREACVWRVWDKKKQRILYLTNEIKTEFLRIDEDVMKIKGFFPFPKPVFATLANNGLIPVPDYTEIKNMLDELDGVNTRMKLTMQALKVTGAYDGSFPELANILSKDVTLIEIADFEKVREKGGIEGFVGFMPIGQYIEALQALAERRANLIQAIYEITGVSDIMRGNADPNETATAVTKKTNFGTLRNQDRQNDFQRFLTDVLKIKAEIICEMFTPELLAQYADQNTKSEVISAAIDLLKTDKIRNLTLGIETDTSFMQDEEAEKTMSAVKAIHDMITTAFPVVSAQPALLGLYKQMVESVVVTLPNTRQFTAAVDEAFGKIEGELSAPQPDEPSDDAMKARADMMKAQADITKNQNEFAIKQRQNEIREQEVQLKNQVENRKLDLTEDEMAAQIALKEEELAIKGNTNENVTTGFVRGF